MEQPFNTTDRPQTLRGAGMKAAPLNWNSPIYLLTAQPDIILPSLFREEEEAGDHDVTSPRPGSFSSSRGSVSSTLSDSYSCFSDYEAAETKPTLSFTYSQYGSLRNHVLRCDIETVDLDSLDEDFRKENCIYPNAVVPLSEYTGRRRKFEQTSNEIGWCLAYLNSDIRGRRGIIQRATDCYKNSSDDPVMHSRRSRKANFPNRGRRRRRRG